MHSQLNILDAIGNTPLAELRRIVPKGSARIVAKLESANPTGSMKDRLARTMIERATAAGRLPPGGTVVEYTAETTSFACDSPSARVLTEAALKRGRQHSLPNWFGVAYRLHACGDPCTQA